MHRTVPAMGNFMKPNFAPHRRAASPLARLLVWAATLWLGPAIGLRADDVDDYVVAQMSRQHIPGLSLAVLKNGRPVKVQGYGIANLELGTPAAPESVYQIGSVSKQFIAAGIVLLSAESKVALDDSVAKYLEDAPDAWRAITIRHLLTHTSGLVRETPGLQLKAQSDIDAIRAGYTVPLVFAPGEKWQYSNLGYFVLAEIISRAAQLPWPQFLQRRIFAPLGMNATRTTTGDELVPARAAGYHWTDDGKYRNAPLLAGVRPSGALLSSVLDLAKWDAALSSDGLFSSAQRQLMWSPVKLSDGSEKPYGFGWEIGKSGSHRQVKHGGTMLGFRSQILRFPEDGMTIIVLTNATQALPDRIAPGVAAFYLPDLNPPAPKRVAVKLSAETLGNYVGRYQIPGRILTVARREDDLTVSMALQGLGKEIDPLLQGVSMEMALLRAETATRFVNVDDPRFTYVFSHDGEGRLQFAVEDQNGKLNQPARKLAPEK